MRFNKLALAAIIALTSSIGSLASADVGDTLSPYTFSYEVSGQQVVEYHYDHSNDQSALNEATLATAEIFQKRGFEKIAFESVQSFSFCKRPSNFALHCATFVCAQQLSSSREGHSVIRIEANPVELGGTRQSQAFETSSIVRALGSGANPLNVSLVVRSRAP